MDYWRTELNLSLSKSSRSLTTTMWPPKSKRKRHNSNVNRTACLRLAMCPLLLTTPNILIAAANTTGTITTDREPLQSWFTDEGQNQKAPRPYGTLNGFDVGGPDPICFVSQLVNASSGSNDRDGGRAKYKNAVLEDENDVLFWNATQEEARLLSSCPFNTSLQVHGTTFDPQWPDTLFTGQPYDFYMNLTMTIPNASPLLVDFQNNSRLHFRLVLCNALLRGSCSPVIDFNYQKVMWDRHTQQQQQQQNHTDSHQGQNKPVPLLVGIANEAQRAIASPFVRYENEDIVIEADDSASDHRHQMLEANLKVQFQIPHNVQVGTYLFIAHAKFLVKDNETDTLQRLDVAASLPQFSIQVQHPPNIQRVSRGQKIGLAVASGLVGLTSLVALIFIIYHRNHPVMKLAQAPFLMALLMCVLIGSSFCFTLMPETNVYCFLRGLLVDLPYATSAAILLARCWRVHVTLCNVNAFGRSTTTTTRSGRSLCCRHDTFSVGQNTVHALTFMAKLPGRLCQFCTTCVARPCWKVSCSNGTTSPTRPMSRSSQRASVRQTATAAETASLCVILAMPELVLQILGITLASPELELQYDEKAEIGRYTCQSETRWVQKAGLAWMGVLLVMAVTVAWAGRDLPQAFNEKTAIFNTASVCAVILLVSLVFTGITTDDAQTTPFVPLFLGCLNIFGLSIAILVNIVLPKILRVLSGEKVVLTHLLARYNQQTAGGCLAAGQDGSMEDYRRSLLAQKRSSSVATSSIGQALHGASVIYSPGAIVKLKRDDPLPRKLENGIYDVHGLLGQVSRLCGEGRTPSTLHWNKMRRTIAQLKMELDMVELSWSSEDDIGDDDDDSHHGDQDEEEPSSSSMPISTNGTASEEHSSPQDKENVNDNV